MKSKAPNDPSGFTYEGMYDMLRMKRSTYREWASVLDPDPKWSVLSSKVVFYYRIMRDMIRDMGVRASEMSQEDWGNVYEVVRSKPFSELARYYLVFDRLESTLSFVPTSETLAPSKYTKALPLAEVVDEHMVDLLNFGEAAPDNVTPFRSNQIKKPA